jgi:uncharacterized protein (TIGR02118 family)
MAGSVPLHLGLVRKSKINKDGDANQSTGRRNVMETTENDLRSENAVPRRTALSLGLAAVAGMAATSVVHAEGASGGVKLTVLYGAPKDPAEFEKYYLQKHMPIASAVKDIKRVELAMGLPGPDGKPPAFYRITELWFDSPELFQQVTATPQWKAVVADVPNFASGGVTILVSKIG